MPVFDQHTKPTLSLLSPFSLKYTEGVDFIQLRYGGSGKDLTINATVTMLSSNVTGCAEADWSSFTANTIALVERSSACSAYEMSLLAQQVRRSHHPEHVFIVIDFF